MAVKLTPELKKYMVSEFDADASMEDGQWKDAVADALIEGTLTREKYVELTTPKEAGAAQQITSSLQKLLDATEKLTGRVEALEGGKSIPEAKPETRKEREQEAAKSPLQTVLSKARGGDGGGFPDVKVKGAWERYSDTKSAAVYPDRLKSNAPNPMAGQPVMDGSGSDGRPMDFLSEREKAASGVFFKWRLALEGGRGLPAALRFNGDAKSLSGETHDEQMILWLLHEQKWGGNIGGDDSDKTGVTPVFWRKLSDAEIKSVIDDTTSGGQYITPIMFDDNVVLPTLLYGEFFPKVEVTPVTRGRRIESGTIGQWTVNSGGGDDTTVTLTTTTSFISAFNTTIFTGDMGIELGLDFLSDSPVDLAGILQRQAGEKMMQWLDEQICVGDGTTEPEGITVASGTTSVSHGSAAPTVGVYVQHLLNVGKEYTQNTPVANLMFGGTQTSYRRARSIAVGASDARLIFGNSGMASYTLFDGFPYGINSNLGNTKVFFGNMTRYRMYRRLGLEMRSSMEGRALMLDNKMLMIGRFRFGGQVEDGAAFTVATDAQA